MCVDVLLSCVAGDVSCGFELLLPCVQYEGMHMHTHMHVHMHAHTCTTYVHNANTCTYIYIVKTNHFSNPYIVLIIIDSIFTVLVSLFSLFCLCLSHALPFVLLVFV